MLLRVPAGWHCGGENTGFWELDADDVVEAIKSWKPGPCFAEARFRESLFCFLENRFRRKNLGKEVQVRRGRADIMITLHGVLGDVGAPVAIELKYNLTSTNEHNRLLGQISEYIRAKVELIVVLCGKTKAEFVVGIAAHMGALSGVGRFAFKGYVIQKAVGRSAESARFLSGNGRRLASAS